MSSTRRMSFPPLFLAYSQLKRAVRAPPTWRLPVGEGANLTRISLDDVAEVGVVGVSTAAVA